MEIALSLLLVVVSVLVLAYMTMVLYRCICTRNYAEWRSSWESNSQQESGTEVRALYDARGFRMQNKSARSANGYRMINRIECKPRSKKVSSGLTDLSTPSKKVFITKEVNKHFPLCLQAVFCFLRNEK